MSIVQGLGSIVVAFSGGVDSTFIAAVSRRELGKDNVLAVNAVSETYTSSEQKEAVRIAEKLDVNFLSINTRELLDENFSNNPVNRCYFCKSELFSKLKIIAVEEGKSFIVDGTNVNDEVDYRPGRQAAKELGVRSPLLEAGIGKDEIRSFSRSMGLDTWDKPQMACLASRFPYGSALTASKIQRVEKAESILNEMGFNEIRVRDYETIARVEAPKSRIKELVDKSPEFIEKFKALGYVYITIDAEGLRSGSMNEVLQHG